MVESSAVRPFPRPALLGKPQALREWRVTSRVYQGLSLWKGAPAGAAQAFAVCLVLGGCDSGPTVGPAPAGFTVRDSAGITILESLEPAWNQGDAWGLSAEPLLTIGAADGPEEYTLFRAWAARRLADGRIVVVNSGTQELRFYDAQGTFLMSAGGEGEGPGEFLSPGFLWETASDTLVVYDLSMRRFSVFGPGGGFERTFTLEGDTRQLAFPSGLFGDGTVLAAVDDADQGDYADLGVVRGTLRFGRYEAEGPLMARLADLPGHELFKGTHPDGSGFTTSGDYAPQPFSATGDSTWFYGSGETFDFQERGEDGRLQRVLRLPKHRRAMPDEVRKGWEEGLRRMRPEAAALWGQIPLPDSLPTHLQLLVDALGNLWVQAYVVGDEDPYWSILDGDGRWLGDFFPPVGLRITDIGEDYLMGVWADTLGVQQIRMYGLEK